MILKDIIDLILHKRPLVYTSGKHSLSQNLRQIVFTEFPISLPIRPLLWVIFSPKPLLPIRRSTSKSGSGPCLVGTFTRYTLSVPEKWIDYLWIPSECNTIYKIHDPYLVTFLPLLLLLLCVLQPTAVHGSSFDFVPFPHLPFPTTMYTFNSIFRIQTFVFELASRLLWLPDKTSIVKEG